MENILAKKTTLRILSYLFKNPKKEFTETELIKKTDIGKGAASDAITQLFNTGIISIKRIGKTKIISLNTLNPAAFSLRQIFDLERFMSLPQNKISSILLFKTYTYSHTKAIVLFGSLAAGTFNEKSDIDLLVITDHEKEINNARKIISDLSGERLNIHLLDPHEAEKKYREDDLINNALRKGILIYGGGYVRELMRSPPCLKELKFLKERIGAAWRNYMNKDYESLKEIISVVSEDMAFFACKIEKIDALSRKDAISKIKKIKDYSPLYTINKLKPENQLALLDDIYMKLFNKTILKGEEIER